MLVDAIDRRLNCVDVSEENFSHIFAPVEASVRHTQRVY